MRLQVPHPELQHFQVGPGAFQRVVLASDGVWDFVSEAEAACAVRNARTAQAAAGLQAEEVLLSRRLGSAAARSDVM